MQGRLFDRWLCSGGVALAVADGVFLLVAVILSMLWLHWQVPRDLAADIPSALAFAAAMVLTSALLGIYSTKRGRTTLDSAIRNLLSLAAAVPLAHFLFEFRHTTVSTMVAIAVLAILRALVVHADARHLLARRVLIAGTGPEALAVQQSLKRFGQDVELVGFFAGIHAPASPSVPSAEILGSGSSLLEISRCHDVDEIVVALGDRRDGALPMNDLLDCRLAGVRVLDLSSYFETALGQVRLDYLRASWLIFGEGFRHSMLRSTVKRAADICASVLLLVLCAPVMLITALLIVMESGFPVLYRQERVGQAGRVFRIIKFRSMRTDAEGDGTPRWAASDDARVTRVGRVIRKLRIDELPQLVNVLKGEMSLVGPRPERPYFVEKLQQAIPFYAARHGVKPGITGWAQVRFRYGASIDDAGRKLQYDLYYVKNHSLLLDFVVLVETIGIVLLGKGR
jgi:sugar transferase (PEP-CTERM system associated)